MNDLPPIEAACGGPSTTTLRRYETDELAGADRERVRAHVDGCGACRELLREFAAERDAAKVVVPFSRIEARLEGQRSFARLRRWLLYLALPLAGAAAALALVPRPLSDDASVIRRKGARLDYLVKTGNGSRAGSRNEPLRAGDRIRFRYDAEKSKYVLIVGVDSDGNVFPYAANGDRSMPSAGPGLNLVPSAVTLDSDVRPERVFAIFSDAPIAVDETKPAAKDALVAAHGDVTKVRSLPLGMKVDEDSVLLVKTR